MIDGYKFFDQQVKNDFRIYKNTRNTHKPRRRLHFPYFKEKYKLIG